MDQQPEIVIHGDDGTEHIFPPGFDPKRAAAIVRAQSVTPEQPQVRSRTGQMYTPPTDSGIGETVKGVGEAFDPRNLLHLAAAAYQDPKGTLKNIALSPVRFAGDVVAHPAHAAGTLIGGLALGAAAGALKPTPTPFNELPLYKQMEQLPLEGQGAPSGSIRAAIPPASPPGATTGARILPMSDAAYQSQFGRPRLGAPGTQTPLRGTLRMAPSTEVPPTAGNLALKAEAPPLATPNAMGAPAPTVSGSLTPEQMQRLPSFSDRIRSPQMYGDPGSEWMSFAEPGSADAAIAKATHRDIGAMDSRWKYLMDSEQGSVPIDVLQLLTGGTAMGAGYRLGRAAVPYAPMVAKSPAFQAAVRAAVLANLVGRGSDASPQSTQGAR